MSIHGRRFCFTAGPLTDLSLVTFGIFHFIGGVLANFLGFILSLVPCATGGILGVGTGLIHGVGSFSMASTGFSFP